MLICLITSCRAYSGEPSVFPGDHLHVRSLPIPVVPPLTGVTHAACVKGHQHERNESSSLMILRALANRASPWRQRQLQPIRQARMVNQSLGSAEPRHERSRFGSERLCIVVCHAERKSERVWPALTRNAHVCDEADGQRRHRAARSFPHGFKVYGYFKTFIGISSLHLTL